MYFRHNVVIVENDHGHFCEGMHMKRKSERTKERIIQAALQLFEENGFENTTVQQITMKAEVAKGTFFNYFPTKEAIIEAIAIEKLEQLHIHVEQLNQDRTLTLLPKIKQFLSFLLTAERFNMHMAKKLWLYLVKTENLFITIWEQILINSQNKGEIPKHIDITIWSHILNSQLLYHLVTYENKNDCEREMLEKTLRGIEHCLQGITEKRGIQQMGKQQLVLLGGGYGGMRILQRLLTNDLPSDIHITLIDKMPYHCLKTEYYALAAGTESDVQLRVPFPQDPRLTIKYATVKRIDLDNKFVELEDENPVSYDTLIIALGCEDKYHGVPGAAEHTLSIQSMENTRKTYEVISNVRPNGVVSIVGAGLSGVEVASELRESRPDLTIKLFDRGEMVLSAFPKRLSQYVQNWFITNGVEVINNSNITRVEENLLYNHDEPIESDAIIWTAGIQPIEPVRHLDVEKDSSGRVIITNHHHLPNDENVFVCGDCASLPHAPSAQLAEGQAEQIVTVLKKRWNNEELPEELPKIKLKGVLGSLGKKHGFGLMGEKTLVGRVPRFLKSGVLWMYKYHAG